MILLIVITNSYAQCHVFDLCKDYFSISYLPKNLKLYNKNTLQKDSIIKVNKLLKNTTYRKKAGIIKEVISQIPEYARVLGPERELYKDLIITLETLQEWHIKSFSYSTQKLIEPRFIEGELSLSDFNDLSPYLIFLIGLTNNKSEIFDGGAEERMLYTVHDIGHMFLNISGRLYLFYKNLEYDEDYSAFFKVKKTKTRSAKEVKRLIGMHERIYQFVKVDFIKQDRKHLFDLMWFFVTHEENHNLWGDSKDNKKRFSLSLWLRSSWKHPEIDKILSDISKRIKRRSTKEDLGVNNYSTDEIHQGFLELKRKMTLLAFEESELDLIISSK